MRNIALENGEYYHIYNRGVDKRSIFSDEMDVDRFMESIREFNTKDTIGSIYENRFVKNKKNQLGSSASKLVLVLCYCLNPNHYHFVLKQNRDKGIEKFMHRLGTGYTKYFNNKYKRVGSLFQGKFKAVHVESNEQLLHLSAYVNLNRERHQLGSSASKLVGGRSSWAEYVKGKKGSQMASKAKAKYGGELEICDKDIVLGQFKNKKEYKKFAENSLEDILVKHDLYKELTIV